MAGVEPLIEAYQLGEGESVRHECPAFPEGVELLPGSDGVLRAGADGPPAAKHFLYRYVDIVKGYVELGKTPPEVVTLTEGAG